MGTLGQIALISILVLPLLGQEKPVQQVPLPQPATKTPVSKPAQAKPVLPTPNPSTGEADRIDKRRERMKGRDNEIDRILKEKARKR